MGFVNPGKDSTLYIRGKKHRKPKSISAPPLIGLPRRRQNRTNRTASPYNVSSSSTSRDSTPSSSASSNTHRRKRVKLNPVFARPATPFESLPTELLQKIFLDALNPSLCSASLPLCRSLAASRHLHIQYLRYSTETSDDLTAVLKHRFFNASLLAEYEKSAQTRLDVTGAFIPQRLCGAPWGEEPLSLVRALVERGAELDPREVDENLETVHEAIAAGRLDVARLFIQEAGLRPDNKSLRLMIEHGAREKDADDALGVCDMLIDAGADPSDVGIWRAALGSGRKSMVEFLLKRAVPPGSVLGELS